MSEELIKRLRRAAKRLDVPRYTHDAALLSEAANALEARPAPVQVPEGAVWSIIRKAMRHGAGLSNSCATTADFNAALDAHAAEYERQVTAVLAAAPAPATMATEARQERAIQPGMYQDVEGKVPARIGDPVALVIQELPEFMRQPAPSAPVAREETALEQFKKFASTEPMTALERLRFFLSCALKPQDWLDVEQFLDALPSAPAAPSVDAEKVMALVEEYGDAMFAAGISCANHEHRNEREYRDDADEAKAQIRALLTAAPAIAKQEWK